uniref:Uncharacterized protein n=1 Tax=Anguilla anguilla TaxID=7936 RepID=A0A0E9PEA2_ANGAN
MSSRGASTCGRAGTLQHLHTVHICAHAHTHTHAYTCNGTSAHTDTHEHAYLHKPTHIHTTAPIISTQQHHIVAYIHVTLCIEMSSSKTLLLCIYFTNHSFYFSF